MKLEDIEYLHDIGLLPDVYYYQLNGKSAQDNYTDFLRRRQIENYKMLKERANPKEELKTTLENALEELLKDFERV